MAVLVSLGLLGLAPDAASAGTLVLLGSTRQAAGPAEQFIIRIPTAHLLAAVPGRPAGSPLVPWSCKGVKAWSSQGGTKALSKNFFLQLFVSGSNTITMQHSPQFKGEDMGLWPCLALGQGTCKALKTRKGEGLILGQILRTTKHASSSTARPLPAVNFHLNGLSVSQNVVMQNTGDQLRNPKSQRVVHRDGGHPLCLDSGLERGPSFCLSAMSFACLWTWIDLPPTQREKTVRTIFSRKFLFL